MEVTFIPNVHNLKEWKIYEDEVVDYFMNKLQKKEDVVIFFEAVINELFSYIFAKYPEYIIKNFSDNEDYMNDLQFKYKLYNKWKKNNKNYGNLTFVAVPFIEDYYKFLKKIEDYRKRYNFNNVTEILYIIRDLENNEISDESIIIKNNNKKYTELVNDIKESLLSNGSPVMETRELLTINSMLKYNERYGKERDSYYLVFGRSHDFMAWNNVENRIKFIYWKNRVFLNEQKNPMDNVVHSLV